MDEEWTLRCALHDAACVAVVIALTWTGCAAGKTVAPSLVLAAHDMLPSSKGDDILRRWPAVVMLPGCDDAILGVHDADHPTVVYDYDECVEIYEESLGLDAPGAILALEEDLEKLRGLPGAPILVEPF